MTERPKTVRCAIYTRKSTEHNLDLEFNSLHAQREACEAYIKSQLNEGWRLIPESYDDGGISGGSLERPDLQRLLADIAAGKVDNVVVYKVDRLTRSLMDFAKLVELFDRHGVSFVSVTQAFNTTNSMGRLTLNVLLSFAQFEREVIGERVRDKIAASKRKGLFMGGNIPLGYINIDKKLVIVPKEADRVRWIYGRYLELGSLGALLEEMNRLDMRSKAFTLADGTKRGNVLFGKGALAYLLKNHCYVGEIVHRGEIHPADHKPIINRNTFDAVQASLAAKAVPRKSAPVRSDFLLAGLLYDSAGNRMTPSHSRKKGVRYRYYVSQAILQSRKDTAGEVFRVPAPDIEALIERLIRDRCPGARQDLRTLIEAQIARITVQSTYIEVTLQTPKQGIGPDSADVDVDNTSSNQQIMRLIWSKKPFRADKGVASEPSPSLEDADKAKEAALRAIGRSRRWVARLLAGDSLAAIAHAEGKGERQIRSLLPLAFMAPTVVKDIITDRFPSMSVTETAKQVPLVWPKKAVDDVQLG